MAHGPHPRDHAQRLPKKMRRAALRSALSARVKDGKVIVVEGFAFDEPKTKVAVEALGALGVGEGKVLLVLTAPADVVEKAVRNLPNVRVAYGRSLATFEVLAADAIVFERAALAFAGRGAEATEAERGEAE